MPEEPAVKTRSEMLKSRRTNLRDSLQKQADNHPQNWFYGPPSKEVVIAMP